MQQSVEDLQIKYIPLSIQTIVPKKTLNFDLYIYFKQQLIKYRDAGKYIEEEHLNKLTTQRIASFYIIKESGPAYFRYINDALKHEMNTDDSRLTVSQKSIFIHGGASTAIDRMKDDPTDIPSYKFAQLFAENLNMLIGKQSDALKAMINAGLTSPHMNLITKHSINVASFAAKFAKKIGLSHEDREDLVIAALLHDLGVSMLPHEHKYLFSKVKNQFTPQERTIYTNATSTLTNLISCLDHIPSRVSDLILFHEEKLSGDGPNKKLRLNKLEQALSLINEYDKRVTAYGMRPDVAFKELQIDEIGNYNLDYLKVFKTLIKEETINGTGTSENTDTSSEQKSITPTFKN